MSINSFTKEGTIVGRLTLINLEGIYTSPLGQKDPIWNCRCSCNNIKLVRQSKLFNKSRPTNSCGCIRSERMKNNHPSITHGESKSKLYGVWHGIKDRCANSYSGKNKHYVDKGVEVWQEWTESYEAFRDWSLTKGYTEGLTIDRIDSEGNYEPNNCRWVTMKVQQNNRSNNKFIEAWGESKSLSMWLEDVRTCVNRSTFRSRVKCGWEIERALSYPPIKSFSGNQHTVK